MFCRPLCTLAERRLAIRPIDKQAAFRGGRSFALGKLNPACTAEANDELLFRTFPKAAASDVKSTRRSSPTPSLAFAPSWAGPGHRNAKPKGDSNELSARRRALGTPYIATRAIILDL